MADRRGVDHAPQREATEVVETPMQEIDGGAAVTPRFPIVGIGASAGGFEALQQLMRHLPGDTGMGFVIVQHMDPTHESHVSSLLQRNADLRVTEAKNGEEVRPNHVYVIPPHSLMRIRDGKLHLMPRTPGRGHEGSVDLFLTSLAEDRGDRAVAIILSGTLSDGRNGLVEVHRRGGFTFAQRLESAKYDEMPRNAIATGCVDFVLDPQEMAPRLASIGEQLTSGVPAITSDEETESSDLQGLIRLVQRGTGVDFSQYKRSTLERRVQRRMIATQCSDLAAYVSFVRDNPGEAHHLYEEILIHVTDFFRDPKLWDTLTSRILPDLLDHRDPDEPVRIWIPGCATGEEAYSIAIACLEYMHEKDLHVPVQVFATDLSERAIRTARAGVYDEQAMSGLPEELRRRYGTRADGELQINKVVRGMCVFAVHDVTRDPPFSNMDLVSCRNLLIYLEPAAQRLVLEFLHYALRPSGYLMLGASETPDRRADLFRSVERAPQVYRPVPGRHAPPAAAPRTNLTINTIAKNRQNALPKAPLPPESIEAMADRILAERVGPASIIVDSGMQIVGTRGDVRPFLRPERTSSSNTLGERLRGGQGYIEKLTSAMARGDLRDIEQVPMRLRGPNGPVACQIEAVLLGRQGGKASHAMLICRLDSSAPGTDVPARKIPIFMRKASKEQDTRVKQLESELQAAQVRLQAVVEDYETTLEELRCANEEALSSNEELQSTNEELQTATEESQSTAEELRTLNEELMFRNMEIHQINNDLLNILNSVDVAIMLLDQDFRIHRFTMRAQHFFGLRPSDLGRSFHSIKPAFPDLDLPDEARRVLETLQVQRVEAKTRAGATCQVHIHPYRTTDDRIEGAVIVVLEPAIAGGGGGEEEE